jgi:hypothetical protein
MRREVVFVRFWLPRLTRGQQRLRAVFHMARHDGQGQNQFVFHQLVQIQARGQSHHVVFAGLVQARGLVFSADKTYAAIHLKRLHK